MTRRKAVPIVSPVVTWILVADGKQAHVYVRTPIERHLPHHDSFANYPVPLKDMALANQGDTHKQDVRMESELRFAALIAQRLNLARRQKLFDRIVIVAPDKMLGEIRKHLNTNVRLRVVAELAKELTHCDGRELSQHLGYIA